MEEKLEIITKKDLEVLSKQAFESAKNKGFYPGTGYWSTSLRLHTVTIST